MSLFSRKTYYKRIIEEIAREAFHIDLLALPGLPSFSGEAGPTLNTLEGLAAVLFLTQRAFLSLNGRGRYETAREYLAQLLFCELEEIYSKAEMRNLVLPLLERRHNEYESVLDGVEEPGEKLRALGAKMIEHFIVEPVDNVRGNLAAVFLVKKLMTEPAKMLKGLNDAGKIAW